MLTISKIKMELIKKESQNRVIPEILCDRIDKFIKWYFENVVKGHYTSQRQIIMRNFIEKIAVWYELRYPDYEINRKMPGSYQENIDIDDVMFNKNGYIDSSLDETSDVRILDWEDFYNTKVFFDSLPSEERYLLQEPRYTSLVYLDSNRAHLHLTQDGIIEESEGVGEYTRFKIKDDDLKGLHIEDALRVLHEKGVVLPENNELEMAIKNAKILHLQREEMLNCVMYRIIERGGRRIGPRRAFLFAKEFGRNIDVPLIYGIDYSDPGLRRFLIEYMKAGGSKDLICYVDYFSRTNNKQKVKTVSMQELIQFVYNDCINRFTPEETALHQRMVDVLASQIEPEKLKKEEAKRLRLQRKLEKSKRN
ncbi:MAG: hypothetical protein HFG33_05775 [Bacilli bacterium]|nr:hypothetical protein [Bacilli bacterium]